MSRRILTPLLAVVLALGACGTTEDEPAPTTPSPTQAPTPEPEPEPTEDAEVPAVLDVFERYVAALVEMENGPDPDPTALFGVAGEQVTIDQVQRVQRYADQGIRRVGEPEVGTAEVAVDGDTARLEVCIDEDGWTAESDQGAAIQEDPLGPRPRAFELTREDGAWLVTALLPQEGASITC